MRSRRGKRSVRNGGIVNNTYLQIATIQILAFSFIQPVKNQQNRFTYPILSEIADRFQTCNREVVAITNATLEDLDLLTMNNALTHSKVVRERKQSRANVRELNAFQNKGLACLMFDGHRDKTLVSDDLLKVLKWKSTML